MGADGRPSMGTRSALRGRSSLKWNHPADVIPLTVAEMDYDLAPAVRAVLRAAIDRGDLGYAGDLRPAAEALSRFAGSRWGWRFDPDDCVFSTDVGVACVDIMRAVCAPGDEVVINPPVYQPFAGWIREVGASVAEVPMRRSERGWGLDLPRLAEAFRRGPAAYLLCSPHNPVGHVHAADELAEVVRLAERHGVLVITDEVHAPLVLPGVTFTPLLCLPGAPDVAVSVTSASKGWNLAALKCGIVVASSRPTRALVRARPEDSLSRVGHLGVLATAVAFTQAVDWLDAVRAEIVRNLATLEALIQRYLPAVPLVPPEASYLAWLDCRAYGDDPAARFLQEARVALEPGHDFGHQGSGWVRLNFATDPDLLTDAIQRMGTVAVSTDA